MSKNGVIIEELLLKEFYGFCLLCSRKIRRGYKIDGIGNMREKKFVS